MSTGLYEELGLAPNASTEEIRKAYKKRALQTHPDRLQQGATAADKSASEEQFRRVNNAYEVLSDPKKRKEYDLHSVWPPPEDNHYSSRMPGGSRHRDHRSHYPSRSQSYSNTFYPHHHNPFAAFEFTDPFTLFNSIFEGTPFQNSSRSRHHSYSSRPMDPFEGMFRMQNDIERFMDDIDRDPFGMGGMGSGFPFDPMMQMPAFPNPGRSGRWVSESVVSSTVNGVTQTVRKRVDSNGNEHITRTLPDGREVRTINGIEQPSNDYAPQIEQSKSRRRSSGHSGHRHAAPAIMGSSSRMGHDYGHGTSTAPPPYTPNPAAYRPPTPPLDSHRRSRRSSDKYAYTANSNPDPRLHEESQHKKRWWN